MSATKRPRAPRRGAITIEFSLLSLLFFTLLFATMEVARAMYLLNTLQEVTRRAAALAAVSDFSSPTVMDRVRQTALLRDGPGMLPLGQPVTDSHLRIDYLSLARGANGGLTLTPIPSGNLPACVARARLNCIADPNGASCIRFVRVRLCAPNGNNCDPVSYQAIMPLFSLPATLPSATTIVKAESLGLQAGSPMCP
ncbi:MULTISPECIES: TadE/TadG family type IV pilus assembly protein [unclassified Duganella]|uniref:TadE/TadG family type IV pilus assembly protein n=1 Tax=unclassified Duganella TaxID=2636909 RepID=UPI000E345431|nr:MULTISPECIES: TadE/TadG family type IV pilus assembly protein [unclassified Duganella]RFP18257.1 pilus assembly protein [Duganella sp. BJB475]RFP34922.1 pilus assembly protein [Duganella sp. BJB476]